MCCAKEWRKRWTNGAKWTLAEVDELISDMGHKQASVRFQAVVVCARAAENIQEMLVKISNLKNKKIPKMRSTI